MIRFNDLQPGDIVLAEFEGQKREGVVKEINREDKEICVETDVQEFWFTAEHLYPIPLSEPQLAKLGFERMENAGSGAKYMKNSFRILFPVAGDFSNM